MASERGQSTVEWIALVLLVALVLGGLLLGWPARRRPQLRRLPCALVREYAPSIVYEPGEKEIPIDYRRCRSTKCGDAPTDRSLDVSQTSAGLPATAFTHVVHEGGSTFLQYWFYYPDSNTTWAGSDKAWKVGTAPLSLGHKLWGKIPKAPLYPGFHRDDWEGYQVE